MSSVEPVNSLNLDKSQQQAFVRYFTSLPQKTSTLIRIFNRSDYYTVHGEDAVLAANELFNSVANVKTMSTVPKLDYLVLSKNNFERFLRLILLVKHYQVEVYSKQGSAKNVDWQIEFRGSPGNLSQFEEILFENNDSESSMAVNSCVMAVKLDKNQLLGVSCIDIDSRLFSVCEFTDNEFFSQLESLVIQMNPRECLINGNSEQKSQSECSSRLKTILERSNIMCSIRRMDANLTDIETTLNRLLHFTDGQQQNCNSLPEMAFKTAMASLYAAIVYLELPSDTSYYNKFRIQILDRQRYVHLDHAAVKALNLDARENASATERRITSIIGLLDNHCRTVHGRRTLAQWLKQPLRDMNTLNDRLDIVEAFVNDSSLRYTIPNEHLRRVPDLLTLSKKLMRKKAKLQDLYRVYQTVDKLPLLLTSLSNFGNVTALQTLIINPLAAHLKDMEKFQNMIESTLDMDSVDSKNEFLIKPSFSDELQELNEQKEHLEERIQKQLNVAARDLSMEAGKTIKLEYTDQLGYFLRVTLKEEPILRKNKNYNIVGAVKGGVRFNTQKLEDLNNDYVNIKRSYEAEQKSVVEEVLNIAAGYVETLSNINYIIAQLDVLLAFANVSCTAPKQYVRPKLLPEGGGGNDRWYLKQVRHPCIEVQDNVVFHANDIVFDRNTETFHIITGPNMGGKSTYIRSVGVAVLLAHVGCFVPADEAEIPIVDSILARVGSEDCHAKGLSTFMLEMVETAGILRTATKNSLVIIDELGRGTSTYEGCGIAWSIAEHLAMEIKSFSMFATHFHEITKLADELPNVVNKYVTAVINENSLTLMYEVKPGYCDKSFGIHVAKMAGFSSDFTECASQFQYDLEDYRNSTDLQNCDQEKRKKLLEEGDKIVQDSLKELQNDEEVLQNIENIAKKLKNIDNPYIKELLR